MSDVDVLLSIYGSGTVFQERPASIRHTSSSEIGGARRDRTADLLNAIQALSQLSYGPEGQAILAETPPSVKRESRLCGPGA